MFVGGEEGVLDNVLRDLWDGAVSVGGEEEGVLDDVCRFLSFGSEMLMEEGRR